MIRRFVFLLEKNWGNYWTRDSYNVILGEICHIYIDINISTGQDCGRITRHGDRPAGHTRLVFPKGEELLQGNF